MTLSLILGAVCLILCVVGSISHSDYVVYSGIAFPNWSTITDRLELIGITPSNGPPQTPSGELLEPRIKRQDGDELGGWVSLQPFDPEQGRPQFINVSQSVLQGRDAGPLVSHKWRLSTLTTASGLAWVVRFIQLVAADGSVVKPKRIVASGSYDMMGPANAFVDDAAVWGGPRDPNDNRFFIGVELDEPLELLGVLLDQGAGPHAASNVVLSYWDPRKASRSDDVNGQWRLDRTATTLQDVPITWWLPVNPGMVIARSRRWRVLATETTLGWAWDVRRVRFMDGKGTDLVPKACRIASSGSASDPEHGGQPGYGVHNALVDSEWIWGGRRSPGAGGFWILVEFADPMEVRYVSIDNGSGHAFVQVQVMHWQ